MDYTETLPPVHQPSPPPWWGSTATLVRGRVRTWRSLALYINPIFPSPIPWPPGNLRVEILEYFISTSASSSTSSQLNSSWIIYGSSREPGSREGEGQGARGRVKAGPGSGEGAERSQLHPVCGGVGVGEKARDISIFDSNVLFKKTTQCYQNNCAKG